MSETCPNCSHLEREIRAYRAKNTRLENAAEAALISHRDAKVWAAVLAYWQSVFPDKCPSSTGIKSARATKFFLRLEAGATPEDVELAVDGAKDWPYVVFGKRQRSGSKSDLADDLQDIVSLNNDANFDFLVEAGRARRGAH